MSTAEPRYCYRHPDRETGLSCSECGRPICADCATFASVGIRCPDHAGVRRSPATKMRPRPVRRAPGIALATGIAPITRALIGINVAIYLIGASQSAGLNDPGGSLYAKLWLDGPDLHNGGWWRLVTTMFLHASIVHIAFNLFALWVIGRPVEQYLGPGRYLGLYLVSGLAGSAGAVLQTPGVTVGASGAIFGILGAMVILEWQITGQLAGQAMSLVAINLVISFLIPGISWGGHVGGLIGGILIMLAYAHWRDGRAQYGQIGIPGVLGLIAVAAASVAIAYYRVRGYG
jgi:membrane associated rhomboid family serine protease